MENNVLEGWKNYFSCLTSFLRECGRQWETESLDKAAYFCERLERFVRSTDCLLSTVKDAVLFPENYDNVIASECFELAISLQELVSMLRITWLPYWCNRKEELGQRGYHIPEYGALNGCVQLIHTGRRGRPMIDIDKDQIEFLSEMQLSWTDIAKILGIDRSTLYRKRMEMDIPNKFSIIGDDALLLKISSIKEEMPDAGVRMVTGILYSWGIQVPRRRIWDVLHEIDPINTTLRWASRIKRRPYSVEGANALWHLDGNHKLVQWRMVIHGAIDGHSRFILYLHCTNNNKSDTVLSCFRQAVNDFEIPLRIRIDRGGENVQVARYMLNARGIDNNCVLTGSSVHNQRIERLWRDVTTAVSARYKRHFIFMENEGILDPLNELDLYALHFVYLPRIKHALEIFRKGWNCHKLRTTGKSPQQMYTCSRISQMVSDAEVNSDYGIDEDGPVTTEFDAVDVPSIRVQLPAEVLNKLRHIDPTQPSNDFGLDIYKRVCVAIGHRQ